MKTILSVTRHCVSFLFLYGVLPIDTFAVSPPDSLLMQLFSMPPAPIIPMDSNKTIPKKTCEFSFGTEYVDQVYYLGRNFGIAQASVASTVAVKHPIGLWVSHTKYYMSSIGYVKDRLAAKKEYSIGFERALTKWWTLALSHTQSVFYENNQEQLQDPYDHWYSINNTIQCAGITLSPQLYALMGDHDRYKTLQMGIGFSKYFEQTFSKNPNGLWSFEPTFLMMLATYRRAGVERTPTWFQNKNLKWAAHELILPVTYRQNLKWRQKDIGAIAVTPTWHGVWAVNPFNDDGARMRPFGYCTVNFKYIIHY
jgi:hypothetical protein